MIPGVKTTFLVPSEICQAIKERVYLFTVLDSPLTSKLILTWPVILQSFVDHVTLLVSVVS